MIKVFSQSRGQFYWFHPQTRDSRWEREPSLKTSTYIEHCLEWAHCVLLSETFQRLSLPFADQSFQAYWQSNIDISTNVNIDIGADIDMNITAAVMTTTTVITTIMEPESCLDLNMKIWGSVFPRLTPTLASVFCLPNLAMVAFESGSPPANYIWNERRSKGQRNLVHVGYCPFDLHTYAESEATWRKRMAELSRSILPGGYVIGMTLGESSAVSNATHFLSHRHPSSSEFVWKYGPDGSKDVEHRPDGSKDVERRPGQRSHGWCVSLPILKRMAAEYKFAVDEWMTFPEFYYTYANRYMKEWKTHVGYKMNHPSDWSNLKMYQMFRLKKMK